MGSIFPGVLRGGRGDVCPISRAAQAGKRRKSGISSRCTRHRILSGHLEKVGVLVLNRLQMLKALDQRGLLAAPG